MLRPIVRWLPVCDFCPDDLDCTARSVDAAIEDVAGDEVWARLDDGRFVCGSGDATHDAARGGASPAALKPTSDAMTATFSKEAA